MEEYLITYEERIAAAQAKMDELKAKLAAASEKSKAACELKKNEIAIAIELSKHCLTGFG